MGEYYSKLFKSQKIDQHELDKYLDEILFEKVLSNQQKLSLKLYPHLKN